MNPIVIRFGGYQKPASIHNRAAARFGEILKREFGDRIVFELVGDVLALGRNSGELPTMVENGELSLCYMSSVRFTKAVPEFRIFELPYLISDRRIAFRALDGALGDFLKRRMRETTRLRVLGFWDNGFRHLSNSVRPIRRPEDCVGLRIRTQMSEIHGAVFRAFGFEPLAADIREFVEKIATDRFAAQDNPLTNIYTFGVHRYHRYITLTGHVFGASGMLCNEAQYRAWPPEVQAAVDAAASEATALQRKLAAAQDEEVLKKFDPRENEVIHLTGDERAAFVAAAAPVFEKYRKELDPGLFAALEEA